jgi:hypothetical protein
MAPFLSLLACAGYGHMVVDKLDGFLERQRSENATLTIQRQSCLNV